MRLLPFLDPQPATSGRIPGSFGNMKPTTTSTYFQWRVATEHWGLPTFAIAVVTLVQLGLALVRFQSRHIVAFAVLSFACQAAGAILILRAKMPAYRARRYWTFGVGSVPRRLVSSYLWGRRVFLLGVLLAILLLIALRV